MRVLYIGSGGIGLPALESLLDPVSGHELVGVVAQPDKPAGRRQELTPPPTKVLAAAHGIPVFQPRRIREPGALEPLAALKPEVIVVMAYGQILPKALLELPTRACLNLHASLLPIHRGAAPIQADLLTGQKASGITVIWMDEGLDTGDILLARPLPIRRRETGGSLHDRLALLAPEALREALERLERGTAPRIPQDGSRATYAPKLTRESGHIDWTRPAGELERLVRAMNPWPAASTLLPDGRRLKVFSVIWHRHPLPPGTRPGSILRADERGLLVAAGEGALLLRDVQPEGKRRMAAGDFLRGNPLAVGAALGGEPRTGP